MNEQNSHNSLLKAREDNEKTLEHLREALQKFREACRKLESEIK